MPKKSALTKLIQEALEERKTLPKWKSDREIQGMRYVTCPSCGNGDMEKICKLRNDFYECEVCGRKWDKDVHSPTKGNWS